jgi:hypothetical protein
LRCPDFIGERFIGSEISLFIAIINRFKTYNASTMAGLISYTLIIGIFAPLDSILKNVNFLVKDVCSESIEISHSWTSGIIVVKKLL